MINLRLKRSDRAFLVGQSGSGKTTLALTLCNTAPRPLVIVDTKWSQAIGEYAEKNDMEIVSEIPIKLKEDIVWRPEPDDLMDPYLLDASLDDLVRNRKLCTVYIDELYQLHKNGRPGPGIVGLYTRGREMGFTTLASSQRPAWVSAFCITEASHFYVLKLNMLNDRKKMAEIIGDPRIIDVKLPAHYFWYGEQGSDLALIAPLDIRPESCHSNDNDNETIVVSRPKLIF